MMPSALFNALARCAWLATAMFVGAAASAQRIEIVWPTPNTAYLEGRPLADYVQPTVSGEVESGLFGCVRSSGAQFHEGLDLKPISRDRRGEALDKIYVVMPGVVRYVNTTAGDSSYGRYIVVEHPEMTPAVLTLYAHLSTVAPGIRSGVRVERGAVIATMGRTAGGYTIPKDRAHLHFEIALWMTRDFHGWYTARKFGSPNEHGLWNGMNIMGVDALDFYNQFRARRVNNFQDYFRQLPTVATVRIATRTVPDFVQRYPSLLTAELPMAGVAGWEIKVGATGLPLAWTPLTAMEMVGYRANEMRIVGANEAALRATRCKSIVTRQRGVLAIGKDLETVLQQLFGTPK